MDFSFYNRKIENGNNQEVIMKLKTLSLLIATLALTLTATPFAVQAQQNAPTNKPAQEMWQKGSFQRLNLTPEQKVKMQEIGRNTRTQIEAVLTSEQKAKLKAAMADAKAERQQGQRQSRMKAKRDVFASLNLTEAQKDQMKQIKQSSRQQMQALLTPEQKAQMKQFQEEMRSSRQQRQPQ
jgi:protein CpxP